MRHHNRASRTFAALAIATLSVGLAAPVQAQNPAHVPRSDQGGRAFWGIPAFPPLPVESPHDLTLAYYQGAGEPTSAPHSGIRQAGVHQAGVHHLGGYHHQSHHPAWQSHHPEWVEGESGLPGAVVEGTRPAPFPYGYFGASGTRHWQRHFGFRQAYTQWTLK